MAVSLRGSRDYGDTFPGLIPYLLWADALDRDAVARVYWLDYELIPRYLDTGADASQTRSVLGTTSLMFLLIDSKWRYLKHAEAESQRRQTPNRAASAFKADNNEFPFPTFLEFSSELAWKRERSYLKFRAGATPPNVSGGGAFL